MSSAYVDCTGCEQRWLDAERVRNFLVANGHSIVDKPEQADLLILITCAVDARCESLSIERLRRIADAKSASSQLIVGGCLPSISPDTIAPFEVAGVFSPRTLDHLNHLLGSVRLPMSAVPDGHFGREGSGGEWRSTASGGREKYERAKRGFKIRINDGCLSNCSYCVVRMATGKLQSIPPPDVVSAFRIALERQEPTVMLMGGDTGAYGLDIGTDLAALLDQLLESEGAYRLFIHDLNANWLLHIMRELKRVLLGYGQRLGAMCVPVQSGSDAVLKRMRRPYAACDIAAALGWIRTNAPGIALGTHIIAGFPGETESDFEQSIKFVEDTGFDFVSCFAYSEHPLADSARLGPKIPDDVKAARIARLEGLANCTVKAFY